MIGIIVALKSEIDIVNITKDIKTYIVDGFRCYVFNLLNKPLVLIYSGVGKANASVAAHILINYFKVNLVINAGFCGGISNKVEIGSFVVPRFVSYYDVDVTSFGYEINQIPHEEKKYEIKND
jgi:adenosylhomocysteine nucleosidase